MSLSYKMMSLSGLTRQSVEKLDRRVKHGDDKKATAIFYGYLWLKKNKFHYDFQKNYILTF